jgi:hypothetical protein
MGRIRSIHPTTPTDPEFAANTVEGRLLALYSLTIADDAGNLERNPLGLKMALFPADEWATVNRITELVDTLIGGRFYEPYESERKQYLHIRNFAKYQKPDHPTAPRYPLFPGQEFTYHVRQGNTWVPKTVKSSLHDRSVNVPRTIPEHMANVLAGEELESERKGKELDLEGNGEDGRGPGREGELALPSPPSGGGGAAASHSAAIPSRDQRYKGNGVEEGRIPSGFSDFVEGLSLMKRETLLHALDLNSRGDKEAAMFQIKAAGFNGPALRRAEELLGVGVSMTDRQGQEA